MIETEDGEEADFDRPRWKRVIDEAKELEVLFATLHR